MPVLFLFSLGCGLFAEPAPIPAPPQGPTPEALLARVVALEAELLTLQERVTELEAGAPVAPQRLADELDGYVTEKDLQDVLAARLAPPAADDPSRPITLAELDEALMDTITPEALEDALEDVVRDGMLEEVLADLVTTEALETRLADHPSAADLDERLAEYATRSWANEAFAAAFDRIVTPPPPKDGEPRPTPTPTP